MADRLAKAIQRFLKLPEVPQYRTPSGASQQCFDASYRFVNFLKGRGIAAEIVELVLDEQQVWDLSRCGHVYPPLEGGYHYVVAAEDRLIDWTARQYGPMAPFPVAIPIQGFEVNWKVGIRRSEITFPRLTKRK